MVPVSAQTLKILQDTDRNYYTRYSTYQWNNIYALPLNTTALRYEVTKAVLLIADFCPTSSKTAKALLEDSDELLKSGQYRFRIHLFYRKGW